VFNVALGLAPILWGLFIDALARLSFDWHGFSSIDSACSFAVALAFVAAFSLGQRLRNRKPDAWKTFSVIF
jgi:hypothetical protein